MPDWDPLTAVQFTVIRTGCGWAVGAAAAGRSAGACAGAGALLGAAGVGAALGAQPAPSQPSARATAARRQPDQRRATVSLALVMCLTLRLPPSSSYDVGQAQAMAHEGRGRARRPGPLPRAARHGLAFGPGPWAKYSAGPLAADSPSSSRHATARKRSTIGPAEQRRGGPALMKTLVVDLRDRIENSGAPIDSLLEMTYVGLLPLEELKPYLADTELLLTTPRLTVDDTLLDAAPRLRFIQVPSTGFDRVDIEATARRGIPAAHVPGGNALSVAEHVFMVMMALQRRLLSCHAGIKGGRYQAEKNRLMAEGLYELWGKTLGIVGFGRIGREVAKRAIGFDM